MRIDAQLLQTTTILARWERYTKRGPGCWEWQGGLSDGYGFLKAGSGLPNVLAHRVSWVVENGPIPDGMFVCHRCDNKLCVRPDHLYLGTIQENTRDAKERGLLRHGVTHYNAKLTEAEVLEMRRLREHGFGYKRLGKRFGVSEWTARSVVNRVSWRHLEAASGSQD